MESRSSVGQRLLQTLDDESVELPQKCGECLSSARRRENQRVASTRNRRPSHPLRLARLSQRFVEPFPDQRVEFAVHPGEALDSVVSDYDVLTPVSLQDATQLLRSPLQDLSLPAALAERLEFDLFRELEVLQKYLVHLPAHVAVERDDLCFVIECDRPVVEVHRADTEKYPSTTIVWRASLSADFIDLYATLEQALVQCTPAYHVVLTSVSGPTVRMRTSTPRFAAMISSLQKSSFGTKYEFEM